MTLRRLVAVALVLAGSWPAVASAGPAERGAPGPAAAPSTPGATAQQPATGAPPLVVTSVSPWVEADGDFQVRFAPTAAVPLDASFSYTVHQRIRPQGRDSLRTSLDRVLAGGDLPGVLQSPVEAPVITLGNPATGLVLDVPVRTSRGSSDRVLLPTPGIHPVELRLTGSDGRELWHDVVFLNRLPDDDVTGQGGAPARMSVTLTVPIDGGPALRPDGRPDIEPSTAQAITDTTGLLTAVPEARLALSLRPNLVSALERSPQPADRRFLEAVRAATGAEPARTTYAAVDTGGLVAANASAEMLRQVDLGDRTVRDATGRQTTRGSWYLDDTVSPESLELLRALGATRVVLAADRLRPGANVTGEQLRTSAVALQGAAGMTATAVDEDLTTLLGDTDVAPAQRANQVLTALMATWFTAAEQPATSFPGPSSVVVVPPSTDPAVVQSLAPALSAGGPLSSDPADVPQRPAQRNGRPLTASLAPRTPADQRGPVAELTASRSLIDAFRSMAPTNTADPADWDLLNAETLARDMSDEDRSAVHVHIADEVHRRMGSIEMPRSRRVVLTSRDATIPLRFRNDLPYDVHVLLRARSLRLVIDGGDSREVVLKPGENRIDLPVTVRASGGSLLRIDLRSPDGTVRLAATTMPVTSSTISGVGAALSIISLLFLAGWWIRTARRRRRQQARDAGDHPAIDATDDGATADVRERRDEARAPAGVGPPSRTPDGTPGSVGRGG